MSIFKTLLLNIRPYRSIHYSGLVIGGSLMGYWILGAGTGFFSLYGIKTVMLAVSIILAFQTACVINDFQDIEGDKITNPERPLINNKLSVGIYRNWGLICLSLSLILSAAAGWVPFAFICLFQILYTVYSVPPFRLKKYFPVNTAIVASNGFIAFMAGFGIVSGRESVSLFPLRMAVMLIAVFITSINMINIKDREGDIAGGIKTIPSMMSERGSRIVIAVLTVIAYMCVPFILGINQLIYPSIIGAVIGSCWVLKKKWKEGPYFITYFAYYTVMLYFVRISVATGGLN